MYTHKTNCQIFLFIAIGGIQLSIDTALLTVIYHFVREDLVLVNTFSRLTAGLCGFLLNKIFTFASNIPKKTPQVLARFLFWWVLTTIIGGVALSLGQILYPTPPLMGLALQKVIIEGVIVFASFFVYRAWVYR